MEHVFGSADAADVLFLGRSEWGAVEVKSFKSDQNDIMRGLYQCVKYLALVEAELKVNQIPLGARSILALEDDLPVALLGLRNTLGVEVADGLGQVRGK